MAYGYAGWRTDGNRNRPGKGILEIKTADVSRSVQYAKWKNAVPQNYFVQIIHQVSCNGLRLCIYVCTVAFCKRNSQIKGIKFERKDYLADMNWLLPREEKFWNVNVLEDKQPNRILA